MEQILVASGTCPRCGRVETTILEKQENRFKALCPAHGLQHFKVLTCALRDREQAEAMLRGEVI